MQGTTRLFNNQAIGAAGGVLNADVDVSDAEEITLQTQLFGTTTPADLAVGVRGYADDGTLFAASLPFIRSTNPAASGADLVAVWQYDVSGLSRIQVRIVNNNVAAKTATAVVFLRRRPN